MSLHPPIVTNLDREWAVAQCPPWCQRGDLSEVCGEIVDDGSWLDSEAKSKSEKDKPNWSMFVAEEVERFERHYANEIPVLRSYEEWSRIWRLGWWPKTEPRKRFPKSAPKEFQPFFRAGTVEFDAALKAATAKERSIWKRFGIAQFKPDDPRLQKVAPQLISAFRR